MRFTVARVLAAALTGGSVFSCAPPAPSSPAVLPGAAPADPCLVSALAEAAGDTLDILVDDSLSPAHAPVPESDAERFAFRQVYGTLLRQDCEGTLRPGLAARWTADPSGGSVTVELGDHRFTDGTRLSARAVLESWDRDPTIQTRQWFAHLEADNGETLVLTPRGPDRSAPLFLAYPELAVARTDSSVSWPHGTGPFAFGGLPDPGAPVRRYLAQPNQAGPVLRFVYAPGADPRDLFAQGADLQVTRDRAMLEYAAGRPDLMLVPLPWDRAYFLVSPGAPLVDIGRDSSARAEFRAALARDAVSGSATGVGPLGKDRWWIPDYCQPGGIGGAAQVRTRIVFPDGDVTARELAERMVALSRGRLALAALDAGALAASLRTGEDAAYIVPVRPRDGPASCLDFPAMPPGAHVEWLIYTRPHLVLRRGVARVTLDIDGVPRILPHGAP